MKKIILIFGICILLIMPIVIPKEQKHYCLYNLNINKPDIFEKIITQCDEDSDCYKLNSITCCPCSRGGIEKSVNKIGLRYYSLYQSFCPKSIMCIMLYSCTNREPICENKRCILK